ncbi:hypothetical protein U1Q18_047148 [Sarracenia purpurea var. burkii]
MAEDAGAERKEHETRLDDFGAGSTRRKENATTEREKENKNQNRCHGTAVPVTYAESSCHCSLFDSVCEFVGLREQRFHREAN